MKRLVFSWVLLIMLLLVSLWEGVDLYWVNPVTQDRELKILKEVSVEDTKEYEEADIPPALEDIIGQEAGGDMTPDRSVPGRARIQVIAMALALLGTPLFAVIGLIALFMITPDKAFFIDVVDQFTKSSLFITLPLFTFAGFLLSESGAPKRLIRFSRAILGWMPGGTCLIVVLTCAFFTAFTGASGVTIIAMGGLLYPILLGDGYKEKFSLGLLTTCGSIGLLFYPSLPLILYAVIAVNCMQGIPGGLEFEIRDLFIAGVVPGILLIAILGAYGALTGVHQKSERAPFSAKELKNAFIAALPELLCPVILVVGYFGGYVHLTEASAILVAYIIFIEIFIIKDIKFSRIPNIINKSMMLIGAILIIVMMSIGFTWAMTYSQVPQQILNHMKEYIESPTTFLLVLNVFLIVVGCLMDIFSAILVVVPLIIPISIHYGINPLHLGIIFLTNLEIGYSTPPVGINLFISSLRFKKSIWVLCLSSLPFIGILLGALALITFVPQLSLYCVYNKAGLWYILGGIPILGCVISAFQIIIKKRRNKKEMPAETTS